MRIFVAGATGAIGRRLVPKLVARGHQVIATTRDPGKARLLESLSAEPVVMDGLDGAGVAQAVGRARPEAIIHQMTALAEKADPKQFDVRDLKHFDRWFAATNRLRTEGTRHLLAAARANGVRLFVAQSYTGWTNIRAGGPVKTEEGPFDPKPVKAQRASMFAIRFLERAVLAAPLEGAVLRYGNFYGPGSSDAMVAAVRQRKMPIIGDGGGVWSWIHLDDAATATVATVEAGLRGAYNVTDDEPARVSDWLPYLAQVVGAKRPLHVPVWAARLLAGEMLTRWMTEARGSSNAKLRAASDWRPRWSSWRDGFRFALTQDQVRRSQVRQDQVGAARADQRAT
jgi:nucleoside-diphosphate-sugar epimerase